MKSHIMFKIQVPVTLHSDSDFKLEQQNYLNKLNSENFVNALKSDGIQFIHIPVFIENDTFKFEILTTQPLCLAIDFIDNLLIALDINHIVIKISGIRKPVYVMEECNPN